MIKTQSLFKYGPPPHIISTQTRSSKSNEVIATNIPVDLVTSVLSESLNTGDINFDNVELDFENLRTPIRSIDRSRWIKIVDIEDQKYLGVRFSFNKKLVEKQLKIV